MMIDKRLKPRERMLEIWAKDRLGERDTIDWAVLALKSIRGELGSDTIALFDSLERQSQVSDMDSSIKTVWRLFKLIAKDSSFPDPFFSMHQIKEKISGEVSLDDITELVQCYRPRLHAEPLSEFGENVRDNPIYWVRWEFKTALRTSDWLSSKLSLQQLSKISTELLFELAELATQALRNSFRVAHDIGWLSATQDLPNYLVHRVFEVRSDQDEVDQYDKDPDAYNNDFAPLVRLLSLTYEAISEKSEECARRVSLLWRGEEPGIFVRLFAFAARNRQAVTGAEVGAFLTKATNHQFWRWVVFPEVATLRALRWDDVPREVRDFLEERLLAGPDDSAFRSEGVEADTKLYHRDHEIARLVDAGGEISPGLAELVAERRSSDLGFPKNVSAVELGLPVAEFSWVPAGKPDQFDGVAPDQLLSKLVAAHADHPFGEGDHAEAFASGLSGKSRILGALEVSEPADENFLPAFRLLLSSPHIVSEDLAAERDIAQRIIDTALGLSQWHFESLADRLSYWLDASDEKLKSLNNAEELWGKLLPLAARSANAKQDEEEEDLTSASLNEPFGHLLSFVIRRCLTLDKGPSALPRHLFAQLMTINGRAHEMWANRMAISINYFATAEEHWLNRVVIQPMKRADKEGLRLWEAFSKFSQAPSEKVWASLELSLYKRLQTLDLSPDAMRRLSEMCVMVWIWSRSSPKSYRINVPMMRSALSLTNDDVRAAAARQFSLVFSFGPTPSDGDGSSEVRWKKIGKAFFEEVWPLEPALQTPSAANDFARIPGAVGPSFAEAVAVVAPFILPFQVWSIETEFHLKAGKSPTDTIVSAHPEELLALLASSISPDQGNAIYDLAPLLDRLLAEHPRYLDDHRVRRLRKLA